MNILLERRWKKSTYTIGRLYVDNDFLCNTLEDTDRGLKQTMSLDTIKMMKKMSITAIPSGTYQIRMDIISPKYSLKSWYINNCHGARVPRLMDVPGYSGVLIHTGNTPADTDGCILVGINDVTGQVTKSKETFLKLYNKMYEAYRRGESIQITIT